MLLVRSLPRTAARLEFLEAGLVESIALDEGVGELRVDEETDTESAIRCGIAEEEPLLLG